MTIMQNVCFIAKDSKSVLYMLKEIQKDLAQYINYIKLINASDRLILETPACQITIVNVEDDICKILHGKRYDVVIIENCLRFDDNIQNDIIVPLIGASRFVNDYCGTPSDSHGMLIGWHQFMGEQGLVKYANCSRYKTKLQTNNTLERISRKDYDRDGIVRIGYWEGL